MENCSCDRAMAYSSNANPIQTMKAPETMNVVQHTPADLCRHLVLLTMVSYARSI